MNLIPSKFVKAKRVDEYSINGITSTSMEREASPIELTSNSASMMEESENK